MESCDVVVIGAGPAGAAAAITASRLGADVVVFERAPYGRDKVCGDGLTPRAVGALDERQRAVHELERGGYVTRERVVPDRSVIIEPGTVRYRGVKESVSQHPLVHSDEILQAPEGAESHSANVVRDGA